MNFKYYSKLPIQRISRDREKRIIFNNLLIYRYLYYIFKEITVSFVITSFSLYIMSFIIHESTVYTFKFLESVFKESLLKEKNVFRLLCELPCILRIFAWRVWCRINLVVLPSRPFVSYHIILIARRNVVPLHLIEIIQTK